MPAAFMAIRTPIFTGTIVGIKNGDAITATYTSIANAASAVGTYPIVANLIDLTHKLGNYTSPRPTECLPSLKRRLP